MDFEAAIQDLGNFKGVKTFKSKYGTVYAVIAEKNGMQLAITPKIAAGWHPVIGIYLRLRVQRKEDWANMENACSDFGFPELKERSPDHWSTEMYTPVALQPVTPYQVGKIVDEKKLLVALVDALNGRVSGAGSTLLVPPETVVEYIRNVFEDRLPSSEQKQLDEFPVAIGDKAVEEAFNAIGNKYFPKPTTDAPASADEGGEDKSEA